MHKFVTEEVAPSMATLVESIEHDAKITKLRAAAHNCPACILAALRQSGVMAPDGEGMPFVPEFDFKAECGAMWAEVNAAREGCGYDY